MHGDLADGAFEQVRARHRALAEAGVTARRLEDGLPEWRLAGFPVAVGLD